MRFTVESLISELNKFPKDLEIITELSFLWNYPDSIKDKMDTMNPDEFIELSMNTANELLIFEGSWEKDNISDVEGILDDYIQYDNHIVFDEKNKPENKDGLLGKLYKVYYG